MENPTMNVALVLWLLCVGASGGMLVLLLLGALDGAFPAPGSRTRWVEVNNQVLNALFTLMSVYQHPALFHHVFLLCRWRRRDAADLRAAYSSNNPPGPAGVRWERAHVAVVVALLHLTVACQYVLCGLYWGYDEGTRPEILEDGFFVLGVVAPVAAAAYTACSPLGRKSNQQPELLPLLSPDDATSVTVTVKREVVVEPEWAGGMFDCCDEPATWCLSASCTFCVFGWNADRLGFGNRFVHAITFALLCFAPLCVLGVSALHIFRDQVVVIGDVVGGAGVVLCACGLLYGGYWRVQMRRRFGLPGSTSTDYARWLLCWPCALAQEVRTASRYHVDGDNFFYRSPKVVDHVRQALLNQCDTVVAAAVSSPNDGHHHTVVVHDDEAMVPPPAQVVVVLQVAQDDDQCRVIPHSPVPISFKVMEEDESSVNEDANHHSDGSGRVEKIKKLIHMVTLVSLLILFYTRGFIR